MKKVCLSLLGIIACLAVGSFVIAANQIKTTETHITDSDVAVSGANNSTLTLYIGDNLSGVTTPMKSAHIAVSGTYTTTGAGTLTVQLDANAAQQFTLANVGAVPAPFEILYNAAGQIAPTSAGSYTYALTITPSAGVVVYGLAAKAVTTHRYKPPACGAGLPATGFVESSTFDTGIADGAAYNSIIWYGPALPENTTVRLQLATSNSSTGPWTYRGPDTNIDGICNTDEYYEPQPGVPMEIGCATDAYHKNKRYFRYKATLCSNASSGCTASGSNTPTIQGASGGIIVNWSP